MVTAKPKAAAPAPAPAVLSTPAAAPAVSAPPAVGQSASPAALSSPAVTSTPIASTTASTPIAKPAAPALNAEVVANLVAMGFPETESRAALSAAQGNADLAVEFLMGGIPPGVLAAAQALAIRSEPKVAGLW